MVSVKAYVSLKHEGDKVIVFERAGLLFIFNCKHLPLHVGCQCIDMSKSIRPNHSLTTELALIPQESTRSS